MPEAYHIGRKGKTLLLLLFFWLCIAHGQDFNYGIYGGVTASQVHGDSYSGFNKLGVNAGFFLNKPMNYNIYWQAEIKYVNRGVYKGLSNNDQTLYKSTYHYLEIPLSLHYLADDKYLFELGISPEVLLGTAYWDENGLLSPDAYPENRNLGLSVFAGVGYSFGERMRVTLRYTHSAFPFRDPQEWNHPRYRGYYHKVISLSLAYRISQN